MAMGEEADQGLWERRIMYSGTHYKVADAGTEEADGTHDGGQDEQSWHHQPARVERGGEMLEDHDSHEDTKCSASGVNAEREALTACRQ